MKPSDSKECESASAEIDQHIAELNDWRGETLRLIRQLIHEAEPGIVEDVKWRKPSNAMRGVPVWSSHGIICTGEVYKDKIKLTFAYGASLEDKNNLFNASLDGGTRRAIDIKEGQKVNGRAFKSLIKAAVRFNTSRAS